MRNHDMGERKMYDATCSSCGQATKVPFEPDPNRKVFCTDCFRKERPQRNNHH